MENPAFNENTLRRANMPPQKTYRANLDREEIRKAADPILLKAFEHLWRQIDETDLEITLYEI